MKYVMDIVLAEQLLPKRFGWIDPQGLGVEGLMVEAQQTSAAEAVDQQQLIV